MRSVLRGWCFCESSVSNLVKNFDFVLDLAKFDESVTELRDVIQGCIAKRAPPLAPVFKEDLSTKTFTSPKADLETVGNLYEKEFDEKLGEATELWYMRPAVDGRGRGKAVRGDRDRQAGEARGTRPRHNQIGDAGAAALAEVADKLPQLKTSALDASSARPPTTNISQQGKDALKAPRQPQHLSALPNCDVYF